MSACYIAGDQEECIKKDVLDGKYQLVLFTPELLLNCKIWRKMLVGDTYRHRLRAFVIDEAHTVKKW